MKTNPAVFNEALKVLLRLSQATGYPENEQVAKLVSEFEDVENPERYGTTLMQVKHQCDQIRDYLLPFPNSEAAINLLDAAEDVVCSVFLE